MSYIKQLSVSIFAAVLLVSLFFAASPQHCLSGFAQASSTFPFLGEEYSNGTMVQSNSPLLVWYDWVDVSGTQVINYAMYTTPDWNYSVPIANLIGQHLHLADGSEVFVASALDGMEVYSDLNGDGIPQANFTSGESEILYFMYSNMSAAYNVIPLEKTTEDDVPHYRWGFTYEDVYVYLQNATTHLGVAVRFKLDHLTLSYDFSVNGNVSNLKTSFDIGKAKNIQVFDPATYEYADSAEFSLDGLSLSLLYATATYASKPYSTSVNGQPYNSSIADTSAVEAEIAQVAVGEANAYDFIFGGNYTLLRSEGNQTHQANVETYVAKAEAAAISSLPTIRFYGPAVRGISFFADELNLSELFGGSWPNINTNYDASSLVYRICFPTWDGLQVVHDPTYVGYLNAEAVPEFPAMAALLIFAVAAPSILVLSKKRKRPNA